MNQNKDIMKVADLSQEDVKSIDTVQSKIKTIDNKDVILIAYEK